MSNPVRVTILGKEYQVSCPEEDKKGLLASAELVHSRMQKVRSTGKVVGLDRVAVLVALNLAHELLLLQEQQVNDPEGFNDKLLKMQDKISAFLEQVSE